MEQSVTKAPGRVCPMQNDLMTGIFLVKHCQHGLGQTKMADLKQLLSIGLGIASPCNRAQPGFLYHLTFNVHQNFTAIASTILLQASFLSRFHQRSLELLLLTALQSRIVCARSAGE